MFFGSRNFFENAKLTNFDEFELFQHLRPDVEEDPYANFFNKLKSDGVSSYSEAIQETRAEAVLHHLKIDKSRIQTFRHEDCHKIYGYFSSPTSMRRAMVLTAEGMGDELLGYVQ